MKSNPPDGRDNGFLTKFARSLFGDSAESAATDPAGFRSFEAEAQAVMSRGKTHRAQAIVRAAVLMVVVLLVWASLAHVQEVTRGEGK